MFRTDAIVLRIQCIWFQFRGTFHHQRRVRRAFLIVPIIENEKQQIYRTNPEAPSQEALPAIRQQRDGGYQHFGVTRFPSSSQWWWVLKRGKTSAICTDIDAHKIQTPLY